MSEAPIRPSRAQRIQDFRRRQAPVVVWLIAAGITVSMLASRTKGHEFIGLAQAVQHRVSAPVEGTIRQVLVKELDSVKSGDILARLDDGLVQARMQTAMAEVKRVSAELEAARAQFSGGAGPLAEDYSASLRRFRMDEEQRSLDALALRVEIESDQMEVERLRLDADRSAGLLKRGLVSQEEADLARLTYEGLRERVKHNRELLAQMDEDLKRKQQRRQDFEHSRAGVGRLEPALAPLEEAAKVAAGLLEELRVERESMVLRAPAAGEVSQILCREGQSVPDGEPVIVVTESVPSEILAFLPEAAARRFRPGSVVRVMGRSRPERVAESVVTRVGASIQAIPLQLWRDPRVPEYGLPVAIAAVPALQLTPGEVVFVQGGRSR